MKKQWLVSSSSPRSSCSNPRFPYLTLGERLKLWKAEQSQYESERKGEKVSFTCKARSFPPQTHLAHSTALFPLFLKATPRPRPVPA